MLYGTHVHDGTIDLDEEIVDIGIDEDDGYALMNSSRDQDVPKVLGSTPNSTQMDTTHSTVLGSAW